MMMIKGLLLTKIRHCSAKGAFLVDNWAAVPFSFSLTFPWTLDGHVGLITSASTSTFADSGLRELTFSWPPLLTAAFHGKGIRLSHPAQHVRFSWEDAGWEVLGRCISFLNFFFLPLRLLFESLRQKVWHHISAAFTFHRDYLHFMGLTLIRY